MTTDLLVTIGELAETTGTTVSAIRYYDEVGLVTPAARVGGKRRFSTDAIGRVSFIRRSQSAGFTLEDIKTILDDRAGQWPELVNDHLATLRSRRDQLDVMITTLEEVQRCGCSVVAECPRVTEGFRVTKC